MDENTDPAIEVVIRRDRPEITVRHVGGQAAPPLGMSDPEILIWCQNHGSALITNNRSTMPVHLQNHHLAQSKHVPGIFILSHDTSVGEIVADLKLIWDAAQPGEFENQLVYLPL